MKTVIVLCYLVTLVTAIPTNKGKFKKTDTGYDSTSVIFKRETKSSQNDPATEEINKESAHKVEPALSFGTSVFEGRSLGFKKPLIIKKKFGYHLYRDSDEEKEYSDPHESCSKQVKVKLCDEEPSLNSNQLSRSLTSARLSEHMLDKDMENSIKMAKEAVENLQRDLKNMDHNSDKLRDNSNGESLVNNMEVQHDIEVAREALEHVHKSFGNLESIDFQLRAPETEETKLFTAADEDKLGKWKNAIDNIHKNFEIPRNIEDTFKTESLTLSSDDLTEERKSQPSDIVADQVQQQSFDGTFENIHQKNANDEELEHKDDTEGKYTSKIEKSSTFEEDRNVEDSDMFTASSNKESKMELFSDSLRKEINTPDSRSTSMEKEALNNHEMEIKSDENLTKQKSSINLWDQLDEEHDKIITHEITIDEVPESRDTVASDTLFTNQKQNIGVDEKINELSKHSMMNKNALQQNQDIQKEILENLENNDKTNLAKEVNTENDEQNDREASEKFSQLIQDLLHKEEKQKSYDTEKEEPEHKEKSFTPEEKFIPGEDGALLMRKTNLENDDQHDMHVSASDHHDVRTVFTSHEEKDARDVIDDQFSQDKTWETQKSDSLQSINEQNDLNEFISMRSVPESQVGTLPLSPSKLELDNEQHTSNNILSARMPQNQIMDEIVPVNIEIQDGTLMRSAEVKDKDQMTHELKKEEKILTQETEMSEPRTIDLTNNKDSQSIEKNAKMSANDDLAVSATTFMPITTYLTTKKDSQSIEEKSGAMTTGHNMEMLAQETTTFMPRITDVATIQQVVGTEITTDLPSLRLIKEENKDDEEKQQLKSASEIQHESVPIFKDSIDVEKHMFNERANTKIMEEQNVAQQNRKNHELHDLAEQKELTVQVDQQFKSVSELNSGQILPHKEISSKQDVQNKFDNTRKAEERNTEIMTSDKQQTQNVPATITEFHNRHALSSPVQNNGFENGQNMYNEPTGMRLAEDLNKNHHLHAPLVNRWSQDNENYHFSPEYKSVSQMEHALPSMKTTGLTSRQHNIPNEDTMGRMSKDRNTYGGQQFGDSHRVQDSLSVSWNQDEQNKYYQSQGYNNRPELYGNNFRPHFNSQPYGYGYRSGNQFDLAGNHDFSHHSPRTMEHMHMKSHGKESELDSAMQPNTQLNMRDSGLNLDHHHHSMSRFGAGVPIGGVGSGAVGVFPHSNTGCGIPLMLSCSPSVVSGSIARSHPSVITPSFRSGDDSMYYMKRETKNLGEAGKIQKLPLPFNHKPEFVLNKQ